MLLLGIPYPAAAQTVVNGQIFTNGLAIVDAPAVGRSASDFSSYVPGSQGEFVLSNLFCTISSQFHAGSNIPIAIDVGHSIIS